jgi:glycine/D-amino acid oxidase-like deaminating enzyme
VCYKDPVQELPATADVVIVGGGFAGLATAWALGRRGVGDVVVLEREPELGRFASGRSAGLGRQLAEDDATTELTVAGAAVLRQLPAWTPTGGVLSFDSVEQADAYVDRARRHGLAAELGGLDAVLARWPELADLKVERSLFVPSDGVIDVGALLRIFAHDVRVALGAGVERIEPGGRGARIVTGRGAIDARMVVDASGAWAGGLVGEPPLDAYKRHVFVLEMATSPMTPWLWHVGRGELYLRGDAAGVIASPCDVARCDAGHQDPDAVGEAMMLALFEAAAHELATKRIVRRWACQRAFTVDRKMRLGRDDTRPWLVWAAGLGGHGATASPAVGERVAGAVIAALA